MYDFSALYEAYSVEEAVRLLCEHPAAVIIAGGSDVLIKLREGKLLLSYETLTGQWMLPGGGLESGEEERACCIRELAEETGALVRPSECVLEIDEYYEDCRYVSRYFLCELVGRTELRLTRRETEAGMEPRWLPLDEIASIFSTHASYADTDEMRRGLYLREYTALCSIFGEPSPAPPGNT